MWTLLPYDRFYWGGAQHELLSMSKTTSPKENIFVSIDRSLLLLCYNEIIDQSMINASTNQNILLTHDNGHDCNEYNSNVVL